MGSGCKTRLPGGVGLDKFKWSHEDANGPGWTQAARREHGRFGMGSSRKVRAWACLEGCRWDGMALGSLRTEWRSLDGFWAQTEVMGGGAWISSSGLTRM